MRVGVVLAGGQSRRMGRDKALMLYQGERLVDRALRKLGPQVDVLLLNRSERPENLDPKIQLIHDQFDGFQGPLAGVHAALSYLVQKGLADAELFTVPVDGPFIPIDFVTRMQKARTAVAFANSQGQRHPVFGRWPRTAHSKIHEALSKGERKIDRVAEQFGFSDVTWEPIRNSAGRVLDPFANVNTIAQYEALLS